MKSSPFYNGDDIWFNLIIKMPRTPPPWWWFLRVIAKGQEKKEATVAIEWDVRDTETDKIVVPPTQKTFHVQNYRPQGMTIGDYLKAQAFQVSWEYDTYSIIFTVQKAIHIGRIWEFHRYDVRVGEIAKPREIITEFTIKDIDEHGENYHLLVVGAIATIVGALVVALITALLTAFFVK